MDVSKSGLAEALNVSTTAIDAWIRKGVPVKERGGRGVPWVFVLADVVEWLNERNTGDSADLAKKRALLAREQRKKTTLERKRLEGELAPVEEVEIVWTGIIMNARAKLLAMPTRLAPQLLGMNSLPQIQEAIRVIVYEVLTELSEELLPEEIEKQAEAFEKTYDPYREDDEPET